MVKKILYFLNKDFSGLHGAALVLAFASIASSVLGLFRDRLLASTFGASRTLDIYYASFKIPDMLYTVFLALVSVTVFIPIFLEKYTEKEEEAKKFLNQIFTVFLVGFLFCSVVLFFLIPLIVPWLAPGFSLVEKNELTSLARLMLLSPFLLGLSTVFSGVVQSFRRFFVYALGPIVYNLGIIFGVIFLYPTFGIRGMIYGVVIGAFFHFFVQLPSMASLGFLPRPTFKINFLEIKKVVLMSLPRTIGLTASQLMLFVVTALSSGMKEGSISVFNFSFALQNVPLIVIGASFSVAAFPTMAKLFVGKEKQKYLDYTFTAVRQIIFWSLPVTFIFIVLRAHIVRVILGYGKFDWSDTRLTAAALALFLVSVLAQSLILLFTRSFFAAGRTVKPIIANVTTSLALVPIAYGIFYLFNNFSWLELFFKSILRVSDLINTDVLVFPLAFSIESIINALWLYVMFKRDLGGASFSIKKTCLQSFFASVALGTVSYFFLRVFDNLFNIQTGAGIFFQGFISGIFGLFVWFYLLRLMKNEEVDDVIKSLKQKFWKTPTVATEPQSLS